MSSSKSIHLDLLGERVALQVDDAGVAEFLRELWIPFATEEGPSETISITRPDGMWRVTDVTGTELGNAYDIWNLAIVVRQALEKKALEVPGRVGLHCASVEREGRCLLLAGTNGVGKTTLAMALVDHHGWRLVGDDIAFIETSSTTVLSFPRPVGIKDVSMWEAVASRWDLASRLPTPDLFFQVPASLFAQTVSEHCPPSWLFFPRFAPDEQGSIEALSPAQAVVEATPLILGRVDQAAIETIGRLCRGVEAARLHYPTTAEACELSKRLLSVGGLSQ